MSTLNIVDGQNPYILGEHIRAEDPLAVEKLTEKLNIRENLQDEMQKINDKYKELGFACVRDLSLDEIARIKIKLIDMCADKPYPDWELNSNAACIKMIKKRILALSL